MSPRCRFLPLIVILASPVFAAPPKGYRETKIVGWQLFVSEKLERDEPKETRVALEMMEEQLRDLVRRVPKKAVDQLVKVPLWCSPPYAGFGPRAEYHPEAGWLKEQKRDVKLAKSVEFTNTKIFPQETKRMPVFVLHELAHAYHDRVLGFEEPKIKAAYAKAVASKSYDQVLRGDGRREKAYAMADHKEYFAELSEAFFGRNDFFPFDRAELKAHDPAMDRILAEVWGATEE